MKALFLPTGSVPAKVCAHRLGAVATVSSCTDTFAPSTSTAAELIGFKHNIPPTYFLNLVEDNDPIGGALTSGRCGWGVYFQTTHWFRNGVVAPIPDFFSTSWSAAGQAAFPGVTAGQPKPNLYPNHGQELYDVSGGVYGYDSVLGAGSNNLAELNGLVDFQINKFQEKVGKSPSVLSYRSGLTHIAPFLIGRFIAGRNSDSTAPSGNGRTAYGFDIEEAEYLGTPSVSLSFADRIAQASTTRYWDNGQSLTHVEAQVLAAIASKGWYNDFIHYHAASANFSVVEAFFQKVNETIGSTFVWRAGYDEAMEYMFLRESVEYVIGRENGDNVQFFIKVSPLLTGLYECINTPISVEVDLTGTSLAGLDVRCSNGRVRKISTNVYIVETLLRNLDDGAFSFTLSSTTIPEYVSLAVPAITASVSAGILTVTSDLPTRKVLFREAGSGIYTSVVADRSSTFATTHTFDVSALSGNLRVGAITQFNQSSLISI